ncbi:hypothetical protein N9991_00035 [bacterium]|nr:hypothetical protein [bacterium]
MSRIRADKFVNSGANGAPQLTFGAEVVAGVGLTGAGGINITGVATAASFSGNLTGNVTGNTSGTAGGLTGTPSIVVGSVTGTTGSFSGSVSIGGTLTYEDVTNIDSIGIVTARTGIKVLAGGINAVGVVTATSFVGSGSALTGITTGIAMAQQWRLTSDSTGNVTPLTAWEAIDTYGQGSLGSAMTVSSGVFTYPSTGIYLVLFNMVGYSDNHSQNIIAGIQHTINNSSYNTTSQGSQGIYDFNNSYPSWATTSTSYMFDITDTSNHKTRFTFGAGQGNESVKGHTSINYTTVTFIRLGDT